MDETIEKAKKKLESFDQENKIYGKGKMRWLEASPPNSYDNDDYIVKIIVLEGKPPKGFIIADYASGTVKVFGDSEYGMPYICNYRPFSRDLKLKAK